MSPETRAVDDEASDLEASPGTIAQGKYRLFAALGHGGMADVYLGVAQGPMGFNKLVVVKKLRTGLNEDDGFVQMFLDEGRLAARLNHPNVVHTYEIGQSGDTYFLAMEYLEGQPISNIAKALQKSERKVDPALWARVIAEALSGLHHAHELRDYDGRPMQVIHRDVSPQNLFLTYDGRVKLVDFGIAKAALNASHTETGVLKGKIAYMAPEQALGQTIDRRADIYAMGVVLWEVLAGRRLVTGDAAAALNQVLNHDVPELSEVAPDVDEKLSAIAMKALSRQADDRWPTAAAMRSALEEWLRVGNHVVDESNIGALVSELFKAKRDHVQQQVRAYMAGLSEGSLGSDALSFTGSLPSIGSGSRSQARGPGVADTSASGAVAPSAPQPRGRSMGVIAAAAVVVAIAGMISVWRMGSSHDAAVATAPLPPVAPADVQVTIVASPPSSTLYLDDVKLPGNPYVGRQPRDEAHDHVIRAEADGYQPSTRTVRFRNDGSFELALVAVPPPAPTPAPAPRPAAPRRATPTPAPRPQPTAAPTLEQDPWRK
jgi:serine/threonine-protein kinase